MRLFPNWADWPSDIFCGGLSFAGDPLSILSEKKWYCSPLSQRNLSRSSEILRRIAKTNSLHHAGFRWEISHNKAWRLIRLIEGKLGFPLLDKKIEGQSGGRYQVTSRAKDLTERYERFAIDGMKPAEKAYRKHFGSWSRMKGWR